MDKYFDVIIAGAGPAGASCAKILSKSGLKVLLIERSQEIGAPNFSSAGMPDYVIREFNLPKSIIATYWDKFEIVTKNQNKVWHYPKIRGYVLKFNELKKFLVEDAISHGCQVLIGTSVTKINHSKNQTTVEYSGINRGHACAKIVIDATGPLGILATQLKLRKATPTSPSSGLEYIMTGVNFKNKNNLAFYLGPEFAPHGYAWIFPMGPTSAKVGIAVYGTTKHKTLPLLELLNNFIAKVDILKNAQPLELHGGTLFIGDGAKKLVSKNLVVVGDSAVNINPIGGEGIRHHLYASKFACDAIMLAIKKNNLNLLGNYEKDWKKYTGRRWQTSLLLTKIVYSKTSNKVFDHGLEILSSLKPNDIFDIMFEYKFQRLLKLLPKLRSIKEFSKLSLLSLHKKI